MLKAKTKEYTHKHTRPADAMQVENQKELNEYIQRKSERKKNINNWSAPTMVAAMKYLMLSGREKNTQSIFLMSKKYNRPRSRAAHSMRLLNSIFSFKLQTKWYIQKTQKKWKENSRENKKNMKLKVKIRPNPVTKETNEWQRITTATKTALQTHTHTFQCS